ncbi:MAG: hypothetical protein WBP11_13310 [Dokdonella sp.]
MTETTFLTVLTALAEANVRLVVVGGVAVVLHGRVRATQDIDLVVDLEAVNVAKLISVLSTHGFATVADVDATELADPRTRDVWLEEYGMDVLRFARNEPAGVQVDVFVRPPLPFERLWANAVSTRLGEGRLHYAGIADLIESKRLADRPVDRVDIAELERLIEVTRDDKNADR